MAFEIAKLFKKLTESVGVWQQSSVITIQQLAFMATAHLSQIKDSKSKDLPNLWSDRYPIPSDAWTEPLITGSYRAEHLTFRKDIRELSKELKVYTLPLTASDRAQTLVSDIRERSGFLDSYLWSATSRVVRDIRSSQHPASSAEHTTPVQRLAALFRAVKFFQQNIPDWENPELERLINYHLDRLRGPAPTSSAAPAQ